ncbi:Serine/threonine-protein kinase 36 [Frankliniella fusca]|uniref:non-specific serine/threonine protein kinase n=1 Tax=Frankliniella fusca TaxID=407009 RepID=A0AAE1LLQ6_9NEOP|nr:Serine/threonine-protein kinase 36 [Frankliniella fusca]
MEKYKKVSIIGQGSYGVVYKAEVKSSKQNVALKVITKRKKTLKEIQNLRQEFEIQRDLCHPNIIRMLDSFETEDDIIVVTEFAPQDLSQLLRDKGHLPEDIVKQIVCDLLSALYYLHYHRVLHRDLKPQNILVETNGTAKLCDFGFARSMSMDTYVLTSIKGTPLYMAPEIISQCPYDHSADLWSLGCIVYECLVGSPPYCTDALLRLVSLIHQEIKWPTFLSPECLSFLHGLLQKDPSKRLSWPDLLHHPFVDFSKLNLANIPSNATVDVPLTHPLTASQALAREKQKKDLICHVAGKPRKYAESSKYLEQQENKRKVLLELQLHSKTRVGMESPDHVYTQQTRNKVLDNSRTEANINLSPDKLSNPAINKSNQTSLPDVAKCPLGELPSNFKENNTEEILSKEFNLKDVECPPTTHKVNEFESEEIAKLSENDKAVRNGGQSLLSWMSENSPEPIQCEEWLCFLQKTMEEVMEGEVDEMTQENSVAMLVAPLRNPHASSKVIEYVANLLSLPFVVNGISNDALTRIKEVYGIVKVVPNLVYASNLLTRQRNSDIENDSAARSLRPVAGLGADELHAMECIYLLLCNLTHMCDYFLAQFCDAVVILDGVALLKQLLLVGRRKPRIVADLLAILAHILRALPENASLVEEIVLCTAEGEKGKDLSSILKSKCPLIKSRCCHLLRQLGICSCRALQNAWTSQLRSDLEKLLEDSSELVQEAAGEAVSRLKGLAFYETPKR